jgi:hypothetical protein
VESTILLYPVVVDDSNYAFFHLETRELGLFSKIYMYLPSKSDLAQAPHRQLLSILVMFHNVYPMRTAILHFPTIQHLRSCYNAFLIKILKSDLTLVVVDGIAVTYLVALSKIWRWPMWR